MTVTPVGLDGVMSEFDVLVDEFRFHPREWVAAEREKAIVGQRQLRFRELAAARVMDEWGTLDENTAGRDGLSVRTVRETVECAAGVGVAARDRGGRACGTLE